LYGFPNIEFIQHFLGAIVLYNSWQKTFYTDMFIQVGSQISQMKMEWAGGFTWQSYNEDINSLGDESFATVGLLEQINVTRDNTDYLWYTT
jgi:hypothetical protein